MVEQLDEVNTVICDKGYDSEPFRCFVRDHGGTPVIATRNYGQDIDKKAWIGAYTNTDIWLKMHLQELRNIELFQLDTISYSEIMPAWYRWHLC